MQTIYDNKTGLFNSMNVKQMRKWYVSYLVRASIHFNRFPIELFILFSLSYCSHSSPQWHLWVLGDFRQSRGLSGIHLIRGGNGESRRHPEASITISPFSLCTGADGEHDQRGLVCIKARTYKSSRLNKASRDPKAKHIWFLIACIKNFNFKQTDCVCVFVCRLISMTF